MDEPLAQAELVAALREYLEELQESGVEGLPLVGEPASPAYRPEPEPASAPPPVSPAPVPTAASAPKTAAPAASASVPADKWRSLLGETRTGLVFGSGNAAARLVFVTELPEKDAQQADEPFTGEAGELLAKIIEAMGFKVEDVYVYSVLKGHSRGGDAAECQPFLLDRIRSIAPEAIVALGTLAAQTLLATKEPLSQLRGEFRDCHGIPLMPTFHPAFLVRSPEKKRDVWNDMQQVMRQLGKEVAPKRGR